MFRNRRNSQKPSDGLLADFRSAFPGLISTAKSQSTTTATTLATTTTTLTEGLDIVTFDRQHAHDHDIKDMDPTPRGTSIDTFRFTPSIMDPNSYNFNNFANQPPGYYTPTPGGTNTVYHTQAGDLHTPGLTVGLGTPLSLPTSDAAISVQQSSTTQLHTFNPPAMPPHIFQNPDPFSFQHSQQQQQHQHQHHHHHHPLQLQSFSSHHQYSHHDTGYDSYGSHVEDAKLHDFSVDVDMQEQTPIDTFSQSAIAETPTTRKSFPQYSMENFRFHTKLGAPTAMIKHQDEIPITYLNKGQAYTLTVMDNRSSNHNSHTNASGLGASVPTYRTFVRISFEDEQQRQKPAQCWQLWKEGRGTNEAHHRGGRLQAVEFVHPTSTEPSSPKIVIESESFDGFSVRWTPSPQAPNECNLSMRFNFLSTDFSHSKGVKGIPVRLCSKTQMISSEIPTSPNSTNFEICYCKVKLFRDHGAERKLTNDIAHVKKNIEKLQHQITQMESGLKEFGKRKRSESSSKQHAMQRPGKVAKHKRTWSMSSIVEGNVRGSAEDDLQTKLSNYQDMFGSTRPTSILFLRGEEGDDPDEYPIQLSLDATNTTTTINPNLPRTDTVDSSIWDKQSGQASSIVSPTPSNISLKSQEQLKISTFAKPLNQSRLGSIELAPPPHSAISEFHSSSTHAFGSLPDLPMKVKRIASMQNKMDEWIEAIGIDSNYQPPERINKPEACFYTRQKSTDQQQQQKIDNYYRAIYIMSKTVKDLVQEISRKFGFDRTKVVRTIRLVKNLEILVDDDTVAEFPEGQDMLVEFLRTSSQISLKQEWETEHDDIHSSSSESYELRLYF